MLKTELLQEMTDTISELVTAMECALDNDKGFDKSMRHMGNAYSNLCYIFEAIGDEGIEEN